MNEGERWKEFGRYLADQRERMGIRRREAAKRANLSESGWRDLETGSLSSYGGVRVLPNLSQEVLEGLAAALELPISELEAHVPRVSPPRRARKKVPDDEESPLSQMIGRLGERDRRLVESLVERMLEET